MIMGFGMKAVLVIDMIKDFVTGKFGSPRARQIIPTIRALLEADRRVGYPVVYVCDAHRPGDPELRVWGEHAMEGSEGAQIVDELSPQSEDAVFKKHTYSAFFETGLHGFLQDRGIREVILTGVVTNICVQHTAADAHFRGYEITVPEDCTAAVEDELHRQALETMKQLYGARIVKSTELMQEWEAQ